MMGDEMIDEGQPQGGPQGRRSCMSAPASPAASDTGLVPECLRHPVRAALHCSAAQPNEPELVSIGLPVDP